MAREIHLSIPVINSGLVTNPEEISSISLLIRINDVYLRCRRQTTKIIEQHEETI